LRREGRMIEGVPALLLAGTGEDGVRPVDPRMDAVLGKPFRVEDLETAVERTLTLGRQRAATAAGGVAMAGMGGFAGLPGRPTPLPPSQAPPPMPAAAVEGDLGAIGLPTVLLLLEMEHKTGALHLAGPAPETAELVLRKGRVIRAYVFGPGNTIAGAEAVYHTLTWDEGWFSFHPVEVEGPAVSDDADTNWRNNAIQFPRLICEIADVVLRPEDYDDIAASMDVSRDELAELFDRALEVWDDVKARTPARTGE